MKQLLMAGALGLALCGACRADSVAVKDLGAGCYQATWNGVGQGQIYCKGGWVYDAKGNLINAPSDVVDPAGGSPGFTLPPNPNCREWDQFGNCWRAKDVVSGELPAESTPTPLPTISPKDQQYFTLRDTTNDSIIITQGKNVSTFSGPDAFCQAYNALLNVPYNGLGLKESPVTITIPAGTYKVCR